MNEHKKGIYVYGLVDVAAVAKPTGIHRKVLAQLKALNAAGLNFRHFFVKDRRIPSSTLFRKIAFRLPFGSKWNDPLLRYRKEFDGVDFFYIRIQEMSLWRWLTIRKIRRRNPSAKILYEVPTYPYKKELTSRWFNYPLWWRERTYMPLLRRYIDRIVVVSRDETVFGIPTIPMINGVDLDTIRPIEPAPEDGAIHIAAVAIITRWHGYDRFIRGMAEYYAAGGDRQVVLHLIGEGAQIAECAALADCCGIRDKVEIHGYKTGEELDAIYDRCHLGLISLATQDKDIYIHSTLKSREYLAKGLPTMATGMTDVFDGKDYPYNLQLPEDAGSVDMQRIVSFYDSVYGTRSRSRVIAEIRAFAERTVDIGITMDPVIRFLSGK